MIKVRKIRPSWKKKTGEQGGAIISLPVSLLREANIIVGDHLSISIKEGKIVMEKIRNTSIKVPK